MFDGQTNVTATRTTVDAERQVCLRVALRFDLFVSSSSLRRPTVRARKRKSNARMYLLRMIVRLQIVLIQQRNPYETSKKTSPMFISTSIFDRRNSPVDPEKPQLPTLSRADKAPRTSTPLEDTVRRSISTKVKSGSDWSELPESPGKYSDEPVMLHRSSQCKVKRPTFFRSLYPTLFLSLSLVLASDEWLPTYCESGQLATS